jgi:hypothetical protein
MFYIERVNRTAEQATKKRKIEPAGELKAAKNATLIWPALLKVVFSTDSFIPPCFSLHDAPHPC